MKKKVTMTCTLKSGAAVKDTIKIDKKDTRALAGINKMRRALEEQLGFSKPGAQNVTFGTTTILVSEIAAITFKEN